MAQRRTATALAPSPHLSLTPRGPLTQLELGAIATLVRSKVARAAVQLLGLSRLRRATERVSYPESSWHAHSNEWTRALLDAHVTSSDLVLAFVPLTVSLRTSSEWLGDVGVPAYLLVTPERIALVGATLTGEVYLPASTVVGEAKNESGETVEPVTFRCLEKNTFQLNEHRFKGTKLLSAIARCFEKTGHERVLLAAQTLSKTATTEADKRVALNWLQGLGTSAVGASSRVPEWCLAHHLHQRGSGPPPWTSEVHVPPIWSSCGRVMALTRKSATGSWVNSRRPPPPGARLP